MKFTYLYILLLSLFSMRSGMAQGCNFTISVPNDITICEPSGINLGGIINGNYLGFNWTGPDGFYDDVNLNPSVFITKTSTFKLKAYSDPVSNLIVNGDFSSGNTGFTSDYLFKADLPGYTQELWNEGTYSVVSNPNYVHTNFAPCSDHTGGGEMMVVNGAPSLSQVWCQTVTVVPNTTYIFQAFGTSVEPTSPAILQFSVNGSLLGSPFNLSGTTCNWQEFYEIWDSGAATSVQICVTNQNLAQSGNDFALDDIYFGPLCQDEKEFTITLSEFSIAPSIPGFIDCNHPETTLTVTPAPTGNNYTYNWYTQGGSITSSTNQSEITVDGFGSYFVTVTDAAGCTKTEVFEVFGDFTKPDISISGDHLLNCTKKSTTLTAESFSNVHDITWTLPDFSQITGKIIKATNPGNYIVQVTSDNGCTNTASINIEFEKSQFLYNTDSSGVLTCTVKNAQIFLDVISDIDSIRWNGPGIIRQNSSRDTIEVGKEGIYIFELFLGEDCSIKDSIKIGLLPPLIQYSIPETDTITCLRTTVEISPDSLNGVKDITWVIPGQNPIKKDTLGVQSAGNYHFILTDINGCIREDSIKVNDDLTRPQYSVDIDDIDCISNTGSFTVNGSDSNTYTWSGQNQSSSYGNPQFSEEGIYTLIVTGKNGCKDTSDYYLPSSKDFPELTATISPITCTTPTGTISITSSIPSTLTWTTPKGGTGTGTQIYSAEDGVFTVTALTAMGCSSTETFTIPIDTIRPDLSPIQDFILTCDNDLYTPSLTYGSFEKYLWQGNGLNASSPLDITIDKPGNYSLTLFNTNGCSVVRSFNVTENKTKPNITVGSIDLNCAVPSAPLVVSGDQVKTLILDGKTTITNGYPINAPGTHTLTAINDLGCAQTITFIVNGKFNLPNIALNPVLLNCYRPEIWLSNTGVDQQLDLTWKTPSGIINGDSILIKSNQSVTLIATNSDGCTDSIIADIKVDFEKPDIAIDGSTVIKCTEESVLLTAKSIKASSYVWKEESGQLITTGNSLSVSTPGLYILEGLNSSNGCSDTTGIQISKQPLPDKILYSNQQPLCFGETGTFVWEDGIGGTAPYTLELNGKKVQLNYPVELTSGVYNMQLSDANGCNILETLIINTVPDFAVDAGRDTVISLGASYVLQPETTLLHTDISEIVWDPVNTLSCDNCLNPVATPETDTRYTITIYNTNGCVKQDHVTVRVVFVKGYIAPNIFRPDSRVGNSKFTIFPVENSIRIIKSLSIYDRWGNLIFITKDIEPANVEQGWNGKLNGHDVLSGVYVWKADIEYKDDTTEIAAGDITVLR